MIIIALKLINKCHLNSLFYSLFYFINKFFNDVRLPSIHEADYIINKNRVDKFVYKDINKFYDKSCKLNYNLQIIIPVYNSEKYISECLNSIIDQNTYYNYQIIVVNDGSTDNTRFILNKYKNNPLIRIIDEPNLGRASARNTGLKYVNSNYLMFIDSDDILPQNSIQKLLNVAYKYNSDMVFGNYKQLFRNGKIKSMSNYNTNKHIKINYPGDINGYLWGKVMKSELFNNIYFPSGLEFEDTIQSFLIYPKCSIINSINSCVYIYRQNMNSISHTFNKNNISIDSYLVTKVILNNLNNKHIKINNYLYNAFLFQIKMNCLRNLHVNIKIQKSIFVLTIYLMDKYFKNFNTNIKHYRQLENIMKCHNYYNYILFCILK